MIGRGLCGTGNLGFRFNGEERRSACSSIHGVGQRWHWHHFPNSFSPACEQRRGIQRQRRFEIASQPQLYDDALQRRDTATPPLAGTLTQNSDQRLKTDIPSLDASSSLVAIELLNPVSYSSEQTTPEANQLGFIAQQVQQIFPQLVSTTIRHRPHARRHAQPQLRRPHLSDRLRDPRARAANHQSRQYRCRFRE